MKRKLFIFFLFFLLVFSLDVKASPVTEISETEREILMEQYKELKKRLNYLRWYVKKFAIQEELGAIAYSVIDLSQESTLLQKNSENAYSIASITKLMTAVVASENIDINQEVTLAQEMFLPNSWQRQSPAIFPGAKILAGDLMKASLIQSTNNAAHSLTHLVSEKDFIELMNEKASEIGMNDTSFHDAHGLSEKNESSAQDLAKLLAYVLENKPHLLEITKEKKFQLPGECPEHGWICTFMNLNIFHGIAEFVGGKSGFTNAAGNTFAGVFSFEDTPYSIVLLNTKSRTKDTQKIWEWLKEKPQS